jgi:hypothetical protein
MTVKGLLELRSDKLAHVLCKRISFSREVLKLILILTKLRTAIRFTQNSFILFYFKISFKNHNSFKFSANNKKNRTKKIKQNKVIDYNL